MNQEHHSSTRGENDKEKKDLKKKVDNLQKMLDMTVEHQKNSLHTPKGHPQTFGKYEMM